MIVADRLGRRSAQLLHVDAGGRMRRLPRAALESLFSSGDLVIANDAATLAASLAGVHSASGEPIEVRLAGWLIPRDPTRFDAIAFGAGDHRTRTEGRPPPPTVLGSALSTHSSSSSSTLPDCSGFVSLPIERLFWLGSSRAGGRSSTPMSPNRWPCGTFGPALRPTRPRSSRPQPDLRSNGGRSRSGGGAASAS